MLSLRLSDCGEETSSVVNAFNKIVAEIQKIKGSAHTLIYAIEKQERAGKNTEIITLIYCLGEKVKRLKKRTAEQVNLAADELQTCLLSLQKKETTH